MTQKSTKLLEDEVNAFFGLTEQRKRIFYELLYERHEFRGFLYMNYRPVEKALARLIRYTVATLKSKSAGDFIKEEFRNRICANADLAERLCLRPKVWPAYE